MANANTLNAGKGIEDCDVEEREGVSPEDDPLGEGPTGEGPLGEGPTGEGVAFAPPADLFVHGAAPWQTKDPGIYSSEDRFELSLKELTEDGQFQGYASVFNKQDLVDEIVMPGAFARTLRQRKSFPLLWQHDRDQPIGQISELQEDSKGLKITAKLSLGVTKAKDVHSLIKDKVISGLSIGYRIIKDEWERDTGVRRLKELDLWEISTVVFPANPWARISAVKSVVPYQNLPLAPDSTPWDFEGAVVRVREWAGVKDAPTPKYRRAFLHAGSGESLEDYRLLYADVIDGKLMAIPRGIFAAAGALLSGRSVVSSADMPAVKQNLTTYYKRMGREPPWGHNETLVELVHHVADLSEFADDETLEPLLALASAKSNPSVKPFDWLGRRPEPEVPEKPLFGWLGSINSKP